MYVCLFVARVLFTLRCLSLLRIYCQEYQFMFEKSGEDRLQFVLFSIPMLCMYTMRVEMMPRIWWRLIHFGLRIQTRSQTSHMYTYYYNIYILQIMPNDDFNSYKKGNIMQQHVSYRVRKLLRFGVFDEWAIL